MPESSVVTEALKYNDCALTTSNANIVHSHAQLTRDRNDKEAHDDDWHQGMLEFLDQPTLSMVTTAYEKAPKETRDAFMFKLEENTARHCLSQGESLAIPGDSLAESVFQFLDVALHDKQESPKLDKERQLLNRTQAGNLLEQVGETVTPTVESVAEHFKSLAIHGDEAPAIGVHATYAGWLQETINELVEKRLHDRRLEAAVEERFDAALNRPRSQPEEITLSLGIGEGSHSLIPKEKEERIQEYESTHPSLRRIAGVQDIKRLQFYGASVSQSSASSLELAI